MTKKSETSSQTLGAGEQNSWPTDVTEHEIQSPGADWIDCKLDRQLEDLISFISRGNRHGGSTEYITVSGDSVSSYLDISDPVMCFESCADMFDYAINGNGSLYFGPNPRIFSNSPLDFTEIAESYGHLGERVLAGISLMVIDVVLATPAAQAIRAVTGQRDVPTTDEEREATITVARAIKDLLVPEAWIIASFGAQVLVPVSVHRKDDEFATARVTIRHTLRAISDFVRSFKMRGTASVAVDVAAFDPLRFVALPGTIMRSHIKTSERPDRIVEIIEKGDVYGLRHVPSLTELQLHVQSVVAKNKSRR